MRREARPIGVQVKDFADLLDGYDQWWSCSTAKKGCLRLNYQRNTKTHARTQTRSANTNARTHTRARAQLGGECRYAGTVALTKKFDGGAPQIDGRSAGTVCTSDSAPAGGSGSKQVRAGQRPRLQSCKRHR